MSILSMVLLCLALLSFAACLIFLNKRTDRLEEAIEVLILEKVGKVKIKLKEKENTDGQQTKS